MARLAESGNLVIIRSPSDLTPSKLAEVQARLYTDEQGVLDCPNASHVPMTVAFMPSDLPYEIGHLKMGYYTTLLGLGSEPGDVIVKGDISVQDAINSICNVFFKSLDNLRFQGDLQWGTAQMCPLRSVHIDGDIHLGDGVGGFIADATIEGGIIDGGQQQYLFRHVYSKKGLDGRTRDGQMNFVFVDSPDVTLTGPGVDLCAGSTTCGTFYESKNNPSPTFKLDSSHLPREIAQQGKPRLTMNGLRLKNGKHAHCEEVRSQDQFDRLAPASGMCILIHPGVYDVHKTLLLSGDGIIIMGVGFPVLRSALRSSTIQVTGNNCILASLIVDAPTLDFDQDIMIDILGSDVEIYDVTARTMLNWFSPVRAVKTNTMLHIGGAGAFMENIWLWRGDHWSGPDLGDKSFGKAEWDHYNVNPYGLHVSEQASAVTCLGAFVEHQLWNPIYWNGNGGVLIMTQGECAYTNNGLVSPPISGETVKQIPGISPGIYYTLGANVKEHLYTGGGIYNIFGTMFTPGAPYYPAMEVFADITEDVVVNNCMFAGWVGKEHFSSILRYKGQCFGPAMSNEVGAYYMLDLAKMSRSSVPNSAPAPAPAPPAPQGTTATAAPTPPTIIQSGDTIFLKTRSGRSAHMDVEGTAVQARWSDRGNAQALTIEKVGGGTLNSGDAVYLSSLTGAFIVVEGDVVAARYAEKDAIQRFQVQKVGGTGPILSNDVVCLQSHTGAHLDVEDTTIRARWNDCGDFGERWMMQIEKDPTDSIWSGTSIYLLAHTGNRIEVEGTSVRARWPDRGDWQRFSIESWGGRAIYSGSPVFLKAHTGKLIDVEGPQETVKARHTERGDWQSFTIEKIDDGAIMPGDTIYLRTHLGQRIDVQDAAVQARDSDQGQRQGLVIERASDFP